ncbi:MAG: NAD(P)-dependent oxidoreductase [Candidatus Latescibacterota bacterium]
MPRPRILLLNGTCLDIVARHQEWLDSLAADLVADPAFRSLRPADVAAVLEGAQALILPASVPGLPWAEHMRRFPSLQTLSVAASGYEWLDVGTATDCGIAVTFAPVREGAEVVADLTFGLLLAVARRIPFHHSRLRAGDAVRGTGVAVWGKTLGIVGLGNIGRAVARRARGFEMRILATEPHPDREFAARHGVELVELSVLLRQADFVTLHVRQSPQTEGMIGARELALMRPSAFLINAARQKLVDEAALWRALDERRIAGAAMDDPPADPRSGLLALPNFVATPHLGNRALEGMDAVFRCAVENALAVLGGRRPRYLVNPEVYERPAEQRRFPCPQESP